MTLALFRRNGWIKRVRRDKEWLKTTTQFCRDYVRSYLKRSKSPFWDSGPSRGRHTEVRHVSLGFQGKVEEMTFVFCSDGKRKISKVVKGRWPPRAQKKGNVQKKWEDRQKIFLSTTGIILEMFISDRKEKWLKERIRNPEFPHWGQEWDTCSRNSERLALSCTFCNKIF